MAITLHLTDDQAELAITAIASVVEATEDEHLRDALIGMQLQINAELRKRKRSLKTKQR